MSTQIFGTFGPACASEEVLKKMIAAGMTGMRLNLSHTTLENSAYDIECYQNAAKTYGVNPQILIDMRGPELRVGRMKETVMIDESLTDLSIIPIPQEVLEVLEIGDQILLDDGKILLEVEGKDEEDWNKEKRNISVCVHRGGTLQSGKSIKVIGKQIAMPPLTPHDIENIKVASKYGVTALMQPFVQDGEALRQVRETLKIHGAEGVQIFAKIENRIGVENLESILPEADVIVIARGDLGNDMPLWELPKIQKQIEMICKRHKKPYVVVTQMLASMEENPIPTRAEVSDIYHAVYHGAWGVMLTGETAVGKYPVEAIQYITKTVEQAEQSL